MAKETKSLELANSEVESTVRMYEMFGWEVLSQQRVYHKSQEVTGGHSSSDGSHTTNYRTTTVDFMQVTLQRDKALSNYFEIMTLENEYVNCYNKRKLLDCERIQKKSFNFAIFLGLGIVTMGIGAALYLIHFLATHKKNSKKYKDNLDKNNAEIKQLNARMAAIEAEVVKLF